MINPTTVGCLDKRGVDVLSNNPFEHKTDSNITWGLPRLLAIIDHRGPIKADSEREAARKALTHLRCSTKLGRSSNRREMRMQKVIGTGIQLGLLTFRKGKLDYTDAGAAALELWRERGARQPKSRGHANGMRYPVPTSS